MARCISMGVLVWALVLQGNSVHAQGAPSQDPGAKKAQMLLDAMVQAMGGDRWLHLQNSYIEGRTSGFYQGKPTGMIGDFYWWHIFPSQDRIDLSKKHDVVEIFDGRQGWEITYRGKRPLPQDQVDDFLRRRDHSIETVVKVWMKDPNTMYLYEGQTLAERHLADQVTLISASNDSVTILLDADTHLPLRRSFQWRDPLYKDKNEEVEEYDDYHTIDGIPTPFTITRFHNGDETNQRYVFKAAYNVPLPPDGFDADALAKKIRK
ncbi:hypothetical protein [Pseudacidobacterium ailaaui]|uniref:hypothetical protein n=1 Tax=Pseudacidobacterium ailaaui TaxID=1382359 RepID=UPI0012DDD889|nr:hypothetical protein [Pseudacidobacterium ailaaui]MCL6463720.1 hypothetical protein [Pseudacidobacterium ailaaui]